MKKTITLAITMISWIISFAQTNPANSYFMIKRGSKMIHVYQSALDKSDPKNPKTIDKPDTSKYNFWDATSQYYFKTDISYTFTDNKRKFMRITIPSNSRFDPDTKKSITNAEDLPNYDNPKQWSKNGDYIDSQDFNSWLWISSDDYNSFSEPYYLPFQGSWVFSGIITPLKYRFATGGHTTSILNGDINLGTFVGYRFINRPGSVGISLGLFGGISSLPMNSSNNSNSIFATASSGSSNTTNSTNNTGLNYGGAVVIDVSKQFQLGLIAGWDHAVGDLSSGYLYQDRMWLGFSLNFKFLDFGSTSTATQSSSNSTPATK